MTFYNIQEKLISNIVVIIELLYIYLEINGILNMLDNDKTNMNEFVILACSIYSSIKTSNKICIFQHVIKSIFLTNYTLEKIKY